MSRDVRRRLASGDALCSMLECASGVISSDTLPVDVELDIFAWSAGNEAYISRWHYLNDSDWLGCKDVVRRADNRVHFARANGSS